MMFELIILRQQQELNNVISSLVGAKYTAFAPAATCAAKADLLAMYPGIADRVSVDMVQVGGISDTNQIFG